MSAEMVLLGHHVQVIESQLFMEELHGNTGENERDSHSVALTIVDNIRRQALYSEMLSLEDIYQAFVELFTRAVLAYRDGTIKLVSDFSQKRDAICDACEVRTCWRQDDSLTLEESIARLRNGGRVR